MCLAEPPGGARGKAGAGDGLCSTSSRHRGAGGRGGCAAVPALKSSFAEPAVGGNESDCHQEPASGAAWKHRAGQEQTCPGCSPAAGTATAAAPSQGAIGAPWSIRDPLGASAPGQPRSQLHPKASCGAPGPVPGPKHAGEEAVRRCPVPGELSRGPTVRPGLFREGNQRGASP